MRSPTEEKLALARAGCRKGNSIFYVPNDDCLSGGNSTIKPAGADTERHTFLQYAMLHFRDSLPKEDTQTTPWGSIRGTVRVLEYFTWKKSRKDHLSDWTWKELTDKVKYSPFPIKASLLKLESDYLNKLAVDSFSAIMRYMGDLPLGLHQRDIECVYTILVICHHHQQLRDEVYCQVIKQTTNNKSLNPESSIRGWRLLAMMAAYFKCSDSLTPYLLKYLEKAAKDLRRSEQALAEICLLNLAQTIKYGGRRNVPSTSELEAVTLGKIDRSQEYFLPGGVQLKVPTSVSTVAEDIIKNICNKMGIFSHLEISEFSLYCIVEGDQYTMPLEGDEYIMDLIAELERNESKYYLIFCRSVWHFGLRLDSELYIEIIFHQVVPDYLEGFLMVLPSHKDIQKNTVNETLRIAALLHRAAGMNTLPTALEMSYLIPKPALDVYNRNEIWTSTILKLWGEMTALNSTEAKAQFLELLQKWPLFGSCFFAMKVLEEHTEEECILAVNRTGMNVLHNETHETLWRFSFSAMHEPCNVVEVNDVTFWDIEFGDCTFKKTIRLQVDHAHEVTRLVRQYENIYKEKCQESEFNYPPVMIKV